MKVKKLLSILLILLILGLSISLYAQHEGHQMQGTKEAKKVKETPLKKKTYYCPMHPTYTSDKPGDCPICNMTLVAADERPAESKDMPEGAVKIDSYKQQLIGVKTDKIGLQPFVKVLRTVGRVAFDPELYKAQQEYIEAVRTWEKIKAEGQKEVVERSYALVEAARLKLELNGLGKEQIAELAQSQDNDETLLISSPPAQLTWVYATIYEYELESVKIGQEAAITSVSYPGKDFKGVIVAIDPVFDAVTRSVRARIKADNPDGLLKPNMYVDVQIRSDLGVHLAVPKEAVMDSGVRKVVFVSLPNGYFKPVEVKTGLSTEDYVEVKEGLKEKDVVVVSGNFLIDSESKLKAALEGTGHQHGQ